MGSGIEVDASLSVIEVSVSQQSVRFQAETQICSCKLLMMGWKYRIAIAVGGVMNLDARV